MAAMATPPRWQDVLIRAGAELGLAHMRDLASAALEGALPILSTDPDLLAVARASSAANLALVFAVLRGELTAGEIDPPPQAIAFTRELARRNVPVAELERGYRVVQHTMWRWAVGELRRRYDDPRALAGAIEELSAATFATGDAFSGLVMQRYTEERERWVRSADAVRIAAVDELLSGRPLDVAATSRRLGYELAQTHQAFVAWADGEDAVPESAAAAVGGARALLVPLGVGVIAGWAPVGTLELPAAPAGSAVGVGLPGRGARGFRLSHRQAMEARRVARSFGRSARIVSYADIARLALLTHDHDQAREFAERILGGLAPADHATRRLAETLFVVLEEQGSPRRAGRRLGVHENTVAKRLRAIEARLGPGVRPGTSDLLAALTIVLAGAPPR
jgi:DNA-binding PucR family transcriptional regulator